MFRPTPGGAALAALGSEPVVRARFATAAPRARRAPRGGAIAAALAATARGRFDPVERVWLERIEERRRELTSRREEIRSGVAPEGGDVPSWARGFAGSIPLWGATVMVSIPPVWGRLLFRLVRELRPARTVELGAAFGISALFQAAALELNGEGETVAIDAARDWAAVAEEGFAALGLERRTRMRVGLLEDVLAEVIEGGAPVDFAFVDAEHEGPATRRHFDALVPHLAPGAVVVFDDVWTPREMRDAWRAIRRHPAAKASLGLGRMGLVVAG